jgi:hypothetical protein
MEVTFTLKEQDLVNYRCAVRDRLEKMTAGGFWSQPAVRWIALFAGTAGLLVMLDQVLPVVTQRPISPLELVIGFIAGAALVLGFMWLHYLDQSKKLVRADGPTMSEHTMTINPSGLGAAGPHMTAHYAWPLIQDVTVERGLVLLWLEPGLGLAIPQHAFKSTEVRDAFVAAIEVRRTESDLPRAGSFAAS